MAEIPEWLTLTQATATIVGVVVTTVGVLIALFVALWNVDKNRKERQERLAAQARKVVPAATHSEILGARMWILAVLNHSDAMVRRLDVQVTAHDSEGRVVSDAIVPANDGIDLSRALARVSPGAGALFDMMANAAKFDPQRIIDAQLGAGARGRGPIMRPATHSPDPMSELKQAIGSTFVSDWPATLIPGREVSMAVRAADSVHELRVTTTFEDEAGYQWRRTDDGLPELIHTTPRSWRRHR